MLIGRRCPIFGSLLCGGPGPATHDDAVDVWAPLPEKLASGLLCHLTHEDAVERMDRKYPGGGCASSNDERK
jgi:hypothetical protein